MRKEVDLMDALQAMVQGKRVFMLVDVDNPEKMTIAELKASATNEGAMFFVEVEENDNSKYAPKKDKIDDAKILALRKAGWTLEKIADEVGVCIQTVANHLEKMGYTEDAGEDS